MYKSINQAHSLQKENNQAHFLQEDNGNFSAIRLAFLSWVFIALVMWGADCWQHDRKMQEIPPSVVAMITSLMTGKVVQKFREDQADAAPSSKNVPENDGHAPSPSPAVAGQPSS